jgi:branched-chain amino acid transport system substrate-binding protein
VKNKMLVAVGLVAALAAAGLLAVRRGWIGNRAVRLAAILPLSGADAASGLGMRNAIRLAVAEANARGGVQDRPIRLLELDDGSVPSRTAAAAREVAADERILGAVATYSHDCFLAAQPVLGEAHVPWIPAAADDRGLATVGLGMYPTEFSVIPFGAVQMDQATKYAWQVLGARTFAYVRDGSDYSLYLINDFRAGVSTYLGRTATGEERVASEAEIPDVVAKLKQASPQYVFFAGKPEIAGKLLLAMRAAGLTSRFQTATHEPSQEIIDLAKEQAEGALSLFAGAPADTSPEGRQFLAGYAAAGFREPPGIYGLVAYAETQVLIQALERSFLTRPSVAGALKREKFDSALGPISFNYAGSSFQTSVIYEVVQGRWKPVYASGKDPLAPFVAR